MADAAASGVPGIALEQTESKWWKGRTQWHGEIEDLPNDPKARSHKAPVGWNLRANFYRTRGEALFQVTLTPGYW